jgi:hypothetical protein
MGYWRECACEVLAMWNARANADMEKFRMGIDVHIVLLLDTDFREWWDLLPCAFGSRLLASFLSMTSSDSM